MANVLLGVTGSVAAIRTPDSVMPLCESGGHSVRVVATNAALYFFDPTASTESPDASRNPAVVDLRRG